MVKNTIMNIPWLEKDSPLPAPEMAQKRGSALAGLLAAGGDLSVARLKMAYAQGIFPWFSEGQPILWWSPDPRMVLRCIDFKLHRSLRKRLQKFKADPRSEIRINHDFKAVIRACAETKRRGQSGTWIVQDMITAYEALHAAGYAHSVETWIDDQLVGGLYCVSIGETLFGESMFARQTDGSKIALAALVALARTNSVSWIDCQQNTQHLASLGAREIPQNEFLKLVRSAQTDRSLEWSFGPSSWNALL